MRAMRDAPLELDRVLPTPYPSMSTTERPLRRSWRAVHEPKTPAPTTATSVEGFTMAMLCEAASEDGLSIRLGSRETVPL